MSASSLPPAVVTLVGNLVGRDRIPSYELFRVEVVETGGHDRMAAALGYPAIDAAQRLLRILPVQLAADLAEEPVSRIMERARLDLILTLAMATAGLPDPSLRAAFYLACDLVTRHRELRSGLETGTADANLVRKHLVAELARIREWHAKEIRRGQH